MKITNKADKYGEENKDYQLMIGDADITLLHIPTNKILWNWNFKHSEIEGFVSKQNIRDKIMELEHKSQEVADHELDDQDIETIGYKLEDIEDQIKLLREFL